MKVYKFCFRTVDSRIVFFVACFLLAKAPLLAEILKSDLEVGLTPEKVIQLWGQPDRKEEREASRREIWDYKGAKVVFKEGKVLSWLVSGKGYSDAKRNQREDLNGSEEEDTVADLSADDEELVNKIIDDILVEQPPS